MDIAKLLKWLVAIAIVYVAWNYGLPWIKAQIPGSASSSHGNSDDNSCIAAAQKASDRWGSGVGRFTNPPYNVDAWAAFQSGVESKISSAESGCSDSSESSTKAREAMQNLRALMSSLDSSIRNGSAPPDDIVQRQNAVDTELDAARDLVRQGK